MTDTKGTSKEMNKLVSKPTFQFIQGMKRPMMNKEPRGPPVAQPKT